MPGVDNDNIASEDLIARINELEKEADTLQQQVNQLADQNEVLQRDLNILRDTIVVRLIGNPVWSLRRRLLPEGSRAYQYYRWVRQRFRRLLAGSKKLSSIRDEESKEPAISFPTSTGVYQTLETNVSGEPYDVVIFTIISSNYLAHARTLFESVRLMHDNVHLVCILVDKLRDDFDTMSEAFEIVEAEAIGILNWQHFAFKYDILELNTAVKPFAFDFLFKLHTAEKVIYFDPDIVVYQRLDHLLKLLDQHMCILTPHLLASIDDGHNPNELSLIRAGVYNLGFLALSRCGCWQELLHWWKEKLYTRCLVAPEQGIFVDQSWASLFPSLFEDVHILRNPSFNVAYWNFKSRSLRKDGATYIIDEEPLVFFHFSGFSPQQINRVSKYQDRFKLRDLNSAYEHIFKEYADKLRANGYDKVKSLPYAYAHFDNGVPISPVARRCLLHYDPYGVRWLNPFDISMDTSFFHWLVQPDTSQPASMISPYMRSLQRQHLHLQVAYPYFTEASRIAFARWFINQPDDGSTFHAGYREPIRSALRLNGLIE